MGRCRKAWLPHQTGKRSGLPGYYVCWHEYPDGRQRLRSKHFTKQTAARAWCRRKSAQMELGQDSAATRIPLTDALLAFTAAISNRTTETRRQYRISILQFITLIGEKHVCDVTRDDVDRFVTWRARQGSEATSAKHLRGLKRFFGWCVASGYATSNPVHLASAPPRGNIVRKKPRISDRQFRLLVNALDTDDRRLAVQIAATTGLDRGVIVRMICADIDLEHRQFNLIREKIKRPVYPYLHDSLVPAVAERLAHKPATQRLLQGVHHQGGDRDWWTRAVTAAGIPGLKFVDLRTYAANWIRSILGDFEAQKILGHSSPAVTSRHYYQTNPKSQKLLSRQPLPGSPARQKAAKTATDEKGFPLRLCNPATPPAPSSAEASAC